MPGRILSKETVSESGSDSSSKSEESEVRHEISSREEQPPTTTRPPSNHKRKRDSTNPPSTKSNRSEPAPNRPHVAQPSDDSTSSSESDVEAESSGSSGDEEESAGVNGAVTATRSSRQPLRTEGEGEIGDDASEQDPVHKAYQPPVGFLPASTTTKSNAKLGALFAQSNLEKKQLWHFTAPASLPVDTILEVDLAALKSDAAIIKHKGLEYHFTPHRAGSLETSQLILPTDGGKTYSAVKAPFVENLDLQTTIHAPAAAHGGQAHTTTPAVKQVRQQPEGLRTRYWPPGFEPNSTSTAD